MTKEELEFVINFLKTVTTKMDALITDIYFFSGRLLGKEIKKSEHSECSSENFNLNFQISKKEDMKYKGIKIKKRNDNRWYARVRIDTEYYKYIYGRTQEICLKNLKEYLKDFAPAEQQQKQIKRTTFAEFFRTWFENEKKPFVKQKTLNNTRILYKNYLSVFDKKLVSQITAQDIRDLINSTKCQTPKRRIYLTMREILKSAIQYDIIDKNPMDKVTAPAIKRNEKYALSIEEEKKFVALAKQSKYAIIYFLMLYEGLRTGEAKALAPADIKDNYILVQHSIDDNGLLSSTKTSTKRKVPIFDSFKPYADKYRGMSTSPIIENVSKHTAVKDFAKIAKEINLSKPMYALRHTFATRCEQAGISAKQTSKWLGHTNIETTLEYYVNIDNEFENINIGRKNDTDATQI